MMLAGQGGKLKEEPSSWQHFSNKILLCPGVDFYVQRLNSKVVGLIMMLKTTKIGTVKRQVGWW